MTAPSSPLQAIGRTDACQGTVAPIHEPAPVMGAHGSASGVSAHPKVSITDTDAVAFGYRNDDGAFDVTTDADKARSWSKFAENRVFGLYLDKEPGTDELVAAAMVALQYLEHPDVDVMPFALPASAAADRLRSALASFQPTAGGAHGR